jgi:hypothetical protein
MAPPASTRGAREKFGLPSLPRTRQASDPLARLAPLLLEELEKRFGAPVFARLYGKLDRDADGAFDVCRHRPSGAITLVEAGDALCTDLVDDSGRIIVKCRKTRWIRIVAFGPSTFSMVA